MARSTVSTKTEVKTNGFTPVWPKELDIPPIFSMQLSPKYRADVYFDTEFPREGQYGPNRLYSVCVVPPTRRASESAHATLLEVRKYLEDVVRELNKVSVKRTRTEHDETDDE